MVLALALGLAGGTTATGFAVTGVDSRGQSALDGQAGLPDVGDSPKLASRPHAGASGKHPASDAAGERSHARFATQEARQIWAIRSAGELSLTGRAAIPVLLAGLTLAGAAFMPRRA